MNSIPAQEIKRRGISAVDEALRDGPVHIIKNNRPSYVVLTEADFSDLQQAQQDAARERLRVSLADLVPRFSVSCKNSLFQVSLAVT